MRRTWLLCLPLLASCASTAGNKALDEKLARTQDVQSPTDLEARTKALTNETPGLSPGQRQRLEAIRQHTHDKLAAIAAESLKLRSVLLQDVLSDKPNLNEIAAVKKRLRKLSKDRLNTLFGAADDANEALGRSEMVRQALDLQFIEDDFNAW